MPTLCNSGDNIESNMQAHDSRECMTLSLRVSVSLPHPKHGTCALVFIIVYLLSSSSLFTFQFLYPQKSERENPGVIGL